MVRSLRWDEPSNLTLSRFDIKSFGFDSSEDEKGMLATMSSINALVSAELSSTDLDASRIVLGGFSQGATMSLLTGLSSERKLAGVVALSGWLPLKDKIKAVS
jgi:lysophospholipase-1